MTGISERLVSVRERIADAARRSGRDPGDVTIVAISKTFPPASIREAVDAGLIDFGENKAQEFAEKIGLLQDLEHIRWHFVGHLQRNKVKLVLGGSKLFHALDSVRLARAIQNTTERLGTGLVECLIQVNVSGEDSKFGVKPSDLTAVADDIATMSKVRIRGLMTLASPTSDADVLRREFGLLRDLQETLQKQGHAAADLLSMGMSGDFELAIEEGATHVRIGSAIFGPRACAIGD